MESSAYITLKDVVFSRGGRRIFDGVTLDIPKGKITAIMGPSGTGKTTLLRLIGGQLRPDSGQVSVDGHNVPALKRKIFNRCGEKRGWLSKMGARSMNLGVTKTVASPLRWHP